MQKLSIKGNTFIINDYSNDGFNKTCIVELLLVYQKETKKIGHLSIIINPAYIVAYDSFIDPNFRRIGLGSKLYDYAEKLLNKKIIPYEQYSGEKSSTEAVQFWKKRSGIILQDRNVIYED